MSCWYPSPWWPPVGESQPESPHQAAIAKAEPEKSVEEAPKPRRSRTANTEG